MKIAIPACIYEISEEEEKYLLDLFRRFGIARRRAYNMLRKGYIKSEIEKILQEELNLNSRYIKDAIHSVKNLPDGWVCGGKKLQKLRQKGKISKEEFRDRRDSFILSRGDKSKKGNLNTRIIFGEDIELRINVPPKYGESKRYIYPKLYIPEKYLRKYKHLLDCSKPYTVIIKKRFDKNGYDVRIIVDVESEENEGDRVLALDVNAGHTDFAVVDRKTKNIVAVGKFNHHETQFAKKGRRTYLLHRLADRIGRIAKHFNATVVVGKLKTSEFNGTKKANREVHSMPHFRFRQILKYKLPLKYGVKVKEHSEAFTSKVGRILGRFIGLDVHKASAIAFAIKVIDYNLFKLILSEVRSDEADGRLRARLAKGCGLTAPCQSLRLAGDEAFEQRLTGDPWYPVLSALAESVKASLTGRIWLVKIC